MKKLLFTVVAMTVCATAMIAQTELIKTYAATGVASFSGDGGQATAATLNQPQGIALDALGNLYIADRQNNRIRKITPGGIISTVAGNGTAGFSGDGGAATSAMLSLPVGVAVDANNIYIADLVNNVIRKVVISTGIITTVAGMGGLSGSTGDGAAATAARLNGPQSVAVDAAGNLYIADSNNSTVRKVTNSTGIISKYAGTIGVQGYSGNGGAATAATLNNPASVAVDASNNLYICENGNFVIRKVTSAGIISTYAGNNISGSAGDGGLATSANISDAYGVTVDAAGNVYIADWGNSKVRKVTTAGIITTFAGTGTSGFSGDGGLATAATIKNPAGVATNAAGTNVFVSDLIDSRVRLVVPPGAALNFAGTDDAVSVPYNTAFDFNSGTIECWFKTSSSANNNQCLFSLRSPGASATNTRLSVHVNKNTNQLLLWNGASLQNISAPVSLNTWYHLAVVIDASSCKFYLNGALAGTLALGLNTSKTGLPFNIGHPNDAAFANEYFTGSMDEVRLWSRQLCPQEIADRMNCEIATSAPALLANYHFNQGLQAQNNATVTSLTDASGNNNTGTLSGIALTGTISNWVAPGAVSSGSSCAAPAYTVSATVTSTSVTCNGGATGSASVTASGDAPFTYSWLPSGGTAATAGGLTAGIYSVNVISACGASITKTVSITQPSALVTSTAVTNVSCNGGTGTATITASGGTGTKTYLWSTGAITSTISALTGVYTATVTDANGCTAVRNANITQPSALVTSTAVTNVLCNGGTGSATLTVSGGTPTYAYIWSTGATTNTISALAGVKTVTVTDANGCSIIKSAAITQPLALVTTTAITNVLCNGGTGSATLTVSGGTPTYAYIWSTGSTASNITALAGAYTATVTDANGCTTVKGVSITQPTALTTSTAITNVSCTGGTGSATITASGGTPSYSYVWSTGSTASNITALAGAYTATVTDANGCTTVKGVNISQPTALTTSTAITNVACNGGAGSATLTVSGGTPTYAYIWSTGSTASNITALAGAYTATVTDANGCTTIKGVNISQPTALTTSTAITNVSCNGGAGSATLTVSGGTPTYAYIWSTGSTASNITALAGAFTATVTDANGCTAVKSVSITQPSALVTSTAVTNVLCNGGSTGSATLTTTGGTGTKTYVWSTAATGSVITSQPAGVKTVTVTDANGCTSVTGVSISEPSAIVATSSSTNTGCGTNTGAAAVSASGGTGTLTYSWSPSGGTAATASSLGVGTYSSLIKDANLCSLTAIVNVSSSGAPTAVSSQTNITCNGLCNGAASISASGGITPYAYSWFNGSVTTSANALCAGPQTFTVTGSNGCSTTGNITITEPAVLTPSISSSAIVCHGGMSTLTVTASGGTASYTGTGTYTATAGTYSYNVTDANGCSVTTSITVTEPAAIIKTQTVSLCAGQSVTVGSNTYTATGIYTATLAAVNGCDSTVTTDLTINPVPTVSVTSGVICSGQSFTMIPSGANTYTYSSGANVVLPTADATYSVTGTSAFGCVSSNTAVSSVTVNATPVVSVTSGSICSGQSFTLTPSGASTYTYSSGTAIVSPTSTASYSVTGTSAQGCLSSNTAVSSVTVNAIPVVTVNSPTICTGSTATLTAGGASSYAWSTGGSAANETVNPSITTNYTITGTSAAGCSKTETTSVTVGSAPAISVNSTSVCAGTTATLTASGVSSYTWTTGANTATITVTPTTTTTYSVSGDLTGCAVTANTTVTVTVNALPSVSIASSNTAICSGQSAVLTAGGASTYVWNTSATSNTILVSPTLTTTYSVTGTNAAGCTASSTKTLTVNANPTVTAVSSLPALCVGESAVLTAGGAATYSWTTGATTGSITITPTVQTTYTVQGTNANGCLSTASVTQQVNLCTGIESITGSNAPFINVYPNPTAGVLTIDLADDATVTVLNMLGESIAMLQLHEGKNNLVMQDWPNAVYFIKVTQGTKQHIVKVVKQN